MKNKEKRKHQNHKKTKQKQRTSSRWLFSYRLCLLVPIYRPLYATPCQRYHTSHSMRCTGSRMSRRDRCSRQTRSTRLIESRYTFTVCSSLVWMATFSSVRAFVVISPLSVVSVKWTAAHRGGCPSYAMAPFNYVSCLHIESTTAADAEPYITV